MRRATDPDFVIVGHVTSDGKCMLLASKNGLRDVRIDTETEGPTEIQGLSVTAGGRAGRSRIARNGCSTLRPGNGHRCGVSTTTLPKRLTGYWDTAYTGRKR